MVVAQEPEVALGQVAHEHSGQELVAGQPGEAHQQCALHPQRPVIERSRVKNGRGGVKPGQPRTTKNVVRVRQAFQDGVLSYGAKLYDDHSARPPRLLDCHLMRRGDAPTRRRHTHATTAARERCPLMCSSIIMLWPASVRARAAPSS